jgi:dolichyl-phosphate-mannose-protein mannosyltransferase
MDKIFEKKWLLYVLIALTFITRFSSLSYPPEVVFDEVHFGKFSSAYFTHEYYFDIHPPLGKLMIAGFGNLFGFKPDITFEEIGEEAGGGQLFMLRFLPALGGALFVFAIYALILKMGLSKKTAYLGAILVLFENAILAQSKFILMDIFLLLFGFASLYFYFSYRKTENKKFKNWYLLWAAFFSALAFSIKWTGISFWALICLLVFIEKIKNLKIKIIGTQLKEIAKEYGILVAVPFIIYYLIFAIHFSLLYKSGPGDGFMTPAFKNTLENSYHTEGVAPLSGWGKFLELNAEMYRANAGLTATHAYGSKWHEWPTGTRPIWYWTKTENGTHGNIYLLGNMVIWHAVLLFNALVFLSLFIKPWRKKIGWLGAIFLAGYVVNILPYIFVTRVAFLYHYLPSLVFGILVLVVFYDKILNRKGFVFDAAYLLFIAAVVGFFVWISPLTYGTMVNESQHQEFVNYIATLTKFQ